MSTDETNINATPPTPESPTLPPPPEPIVAPVAPAETISTPEPVTPPVPVPVMTPASQPPPNPLLSTGGGTDVRSLLAKALAKIQFRKQAKLEKIMVLARQRGQVTNDQAQTRRFGGRMPRPPAIWPSWLKPGGSGGPALGADLFTILYNSIGSIQGAILAIKP